MNKKTFNIKSKRNMAFSTGILATLLITLFASCYTPSPLYGTWADNDGNKIQFIDDGTFSSTIKDTDNNLINYEGTWTAVDNVLIFNIQGDNAYSRNTEWDLRGAMLYLTWTANGNTKMLTLYHTAR